MFQNIFIRVCFFVVFPENPVQNVKFYKFRFQLNFKLTNFLILLGF